MYISSLTHNRSIVFMAYFNFPIVLGIIYSSFKWINFNWIDPTWSVCHAGDHDVAVGQAVSRVRSSAANLEKLRRLDHLKLITLMRFANYKLLCKTFLFNVDEKIIVTFETSLP
jgi:hypothetical protein